MSTDQTLTDPPLPEPLRRTRSGRWLGGVCSGIAQRWDIPITQVRALFAVAAVLAGLGALAYLACLLVLPADDTDESPSLLRGVASLALCAAAAAGLAALAGAAGFATLFGFGWAVVVALAVLVVGALVAWPVVRPAWVLLPLVAVALPAVAVAASGMRLAPQTGLVVVVPHSPKEIPTDGYRMGLGDLLVDVRGLRAAPDAEIPLRLDTGIGRTVVALPHDRCFDIDLTYRTGHFGTARARSLLGHFDWRWQRSASATPVVLYGRAQASGNGHWMRTSSDRHAPTLKIDFTSVDGELFLRDYPPSIGPLGDTYWPAAVTSPPSPGALRWAWRVEVKRPAVQRKWRTWRREKARFERQLAQLQDGACAREAS